MFFFCCFSCCRQQVLRLQQSFNGTWEERVDLAPCVNPAPYTLQGDGGWEGRVFGLERVAASSFLCASVMGFTTTLVPYVIDTRLAW